MILLILGTAGCIILVVTVLFIAEVLPYLERRKIRKRGTKTYGELKSIRATGWHSSDTPMRELEMNFSYQNENGQTASGSVYTSVMSAIEARLEIGMILPIIYYDKIPSKLVLDGDLDYEMLNDSAQREKQLNAAKNKQDKQALVSKPDNALHQKAQTADDIWQKAQAFILGSSFAEQRTQNGQKMVLHLRVTPQNASAFELEVVKDIPSEHILSVEAGQTITVFYKPDDPNQLFIQFQ